jgi:hypothetical protein
MTNDQCILTYNNYNGHATRGATVSKALLPEACQCRSAVARSQIWRQGAPEGARSWTEELPIAAYGEDCCRNYQKGLTHSQNAEAPVEEDYHEAGGIQSGRR